MAADQPHARDAPLYAVAAEFGSGAALLAGVRSLRPKDLGRIDAHSPVPISGMSQALGLARSSMSLIGAGAAALGFAASMGLCLYATDVDYVFNIGGRPRVSWPAFVVPSFSFAAMTGAVAVYLVMLFLNRLPRLNHPAFNIEAFTRVSQDRYFLIVEAGDRPIEPDVIEAALATLPDRPLNVVWVPR